MRNKHCLYCNKSFVKSPKISNFNWDKYKFCSVFCKNKSQIKWVECLYCGNKCYGRQHRIYCSRNCAGKSKGFQKGHFAPKSAFKIGSIPWNKNKKGLMPVPWNKGIFFKDIRGENHWNWKGGKPKKRKQGLLSYSEYRQYRDWQKTVFIRDNWTCQMCGHRGGELHADHIKQWVLFPKLRYNINNGRTLCPVCHRKTDSYGKKSSDVI